MIGTTTELGWASSRVEAELRLSVGTVQVIHFHLKVPSDRVLREDRDYRLDLSLTPRMPNARLSFPDHWDPHRYERLGKLFLLPPKHDMRIKSDSGRQASVVCELHADRLSEWLEGGPDWTEPRLQASVDVGSAQIKSLLLRLGEEARHPGFASDILGEAIAVQIAVEMGRYYARITDFPKSGGLAPWRLRLIDERLREVRAAPTLAELAALCSLSVRQLTRGFRASRGCSIGDYIAEHRVEIAKRILATDESVKSIAYSMGFSSPSSFCYAFRKTTGQSPHQFRKKMARAGA